MFYSLLEWQRAALAPWRAVNAVNSYWLESPFNPFVENEMVKNMAAAARLFDDLTKNYGAPEWRINQCNIDGQEVAISPETVWKDDWCRLIHFQKDLSNAPQEITNYASQAPKVLIVAPLSGHFATLLRGTIEGFLPDHEVYITDWADAKNVPLSCGHFDLDDYIDYIRNMINHLGKGVNVVAVCQPGPPVLAAIALMSEDGDENIPDTMCFVGSPIDARKSPTVANQLAEERPFTWFKSNMIYSVPMSYPGAMRRVYPGFVQLISFMSLNQERHLDAHKKYFDDLVKGDGESTARHREFYDEYLSVLDLTEEFYLQTVEKVFQEHHLALGKFYHRGRLVRPEKITHTALLTIEGELDDISGIGQTQAAHDLCTGIPAHKHKDHVQEGVGHYGVFNGKKFKKHIYPIQRDFIREHSK